MIKGNSTRKSVYEKMKIGSRTCQRNVTEVPMSISGSTSSSLGRLIDDAQVEAEEPAPDNEGGDVTQAARTGQEEPKADHRNHERQRRDAFRFEEDLPIIEENRPVEAWDGIFPGLGVRGDFLRLLRSSGPG